MRPSYKGGLILDPAPKAECKWHEGYGHIPAEGKVMCGDYTEKQGEALVFIGRRARFDGARVILETKVDSGSF